MVSLAEVKWMRMPSWRDANVEAITSVSLLSNGEALQITRALMNTGGWNGVKIHSLRTHPKSPDEEAAMLEIPPEEFRPEKFSSAFPEVKTCTLQEIPFLPDVLDWLSTISRDALGDASQDWHYDERTQSFTTTLSPQANHNAISALATTLNRLTGNSMEHRISLDSTKEDILSFPAASLDFRALQKAAEAILSDTAFTVSGDVPLMRPIEQSDIALLNALGFSEYFPKAMTDGAWKMSEATPNALETKVARLSLTMPSAIKADVMSILSKLKKELSERDDMGIAFTFHSTSAKSELDGKSDTFIDVTALDDAKLRTMSPALATTIRHYGALLENALNTPPEPNHQIQRILSKTPLRGTLISSIKDARENPYPKLPGNPYRGA